MTLYAAVEQGFASALPGFVKGELEGFIACGVLQRGFAVLSCPSCQKRKLVAFSCGGRGFCPSCTGRRMAEGAANLVSYVLPRDVALRQFVLTLPFELRARVAYDKQLLGGIGRIFVDSVLGWYTRKMRARGVEGGRSGAVTVLQRTQADLRLNPHYHSVVLDGVFAAGDDGVLGFHPLRSVSNSELGDLLTLLRIRVLGWLSRRGVIEDEAELGVVDEDFAAREPALAALARASVSGFAPAGPERRARPPLALGGVPGVELSAPLSVSELGFSLHAATTVRAGDAAGREALCKYVLRPAIAQERVQLLDDGLVRLVLRKPFKDGTAAIDLDPLSVLCRLAASVPPPRMHTVRFAGVLSAAHKWRPLVVPPAPDEELADDRPAHEHTQRPATHRCHYWPWARLLQRSLAVDGEKCDACGARMKLRALVFAVHSIERMLRHLGEPTELLPLSPARDPPFFKSRAVRRKLGELDAPQGQIEMFGA